jgi:hypothetical protein
LEAPGSRLRVIAHLRGLLKPDYKYGPVSVGAERLVLQALDAELAASTKEHLAHLDSQLIAEMDVTGKKKVYREAREFITDASRLRSCDFSESKTTQGKAEVDSLVDLYYALEKAGIIYNEPDDTP